MRHTQYFFSYGVLRDKEVQKMVLGRVLKGKFTTLIGYRACGKRINDKYPSLIEISHRRLDKVSGTLFKISNFELYKIDQYKSKTHKRIQVEVRSGTKAWTYVQNLG